MNRERGVIISLYENEHIVTVLRKHWIGMVGSVVAIIFLFIFFFVGIYFAQNNIVNQGSIYNESIQCNVADSITSNLATGAIIVLGSIYLLSILGYAYVSWIDYYMDLFIITNERVLRLEQAVLFSQKISETSFQHIQDVSSQVRGFINSFLNIGTIYIETAGDRENFSFTHVKDPAAITAMILELQKNMWEGDGVRGDLMNERKQEKISVMNNKPFFPKKGKEAINYKKKEDLFKNNALLNYFTKKDNSSPLINSNEPKITPTIIEKKKDISKKNIQKNDTLEKEKQPYMDGRIITSYGVIWQSSQELNSDILHTLNKMDDEKENQVGDW